ncbi:MAG: hypothetical protein AB8H03_19330 [Saprospiraceae bacterium]
MKKTNLIITLLFLMSQIGISQSYRTAAGIRLGTGAGPALSIQQKIAKYSTIEGIFQPNFRDNVSSLDLIYEQHYKILIKRVNIYMGAGLHKDWRPTNHELELEEKADLGFVGIIGGEVTFKNFNVSWDYKPSVNVMGGDTHFAHQSAITLRAIIVKQKKKKINWRFWKKEKSKKEKRKDKRAARKDPKEEKKKINWRFWKK